MTTTPIEFRCLHRSLPEVIQNLKNKMAVERVKNVSVGGFYSRLFLVPKKDGSWRPVIDLSALNRYITPTKFKMETTRSIKNSVEIGDFAVSLDLQDAYYHIMISPASRKYLRFVANGEVLQFRSLPFGIKSAPRVFTKIMGTVGAFLRMQGPKLLQYFDDWLLHQTIRSNLLEDLSLTWQTVTRLGLIPNPQKSELIPTKEFTFVGMMFRTEPGIVQVPPARIESLLESIQLVLNKTSVSARSMLSLLGSLNAAADLINLGRLHMRPLQFLFLDQWRPIRDPLDQEIFLSNLFKSHLRWWLNRSLYTTGVPLRTPAPDLYLFTDSSMIGWGAHLEPTGLVAHGLWSDEEQKFHINNLELRAVYLALIQFAPTINGKTVQLATDNTTVVSYIRRQGGTHSLLLFRETWKLLLWCQFQAVQLLAKHVPGRLNVLADSLSRQNKVLPAEWTLKQEIVLSLFRVLGTPMVDLFATRLNHRLPLYVSPVLEPAAWAVDALSLDWNQMFGYAFPPFILIPAILRKIQLSHHCRILLIAPLWPQRSWFNDLLSYLVDSPIQLPVQEDLLSQSRGRLFHANPKMLHLHAWLLSSDLSEKKEFSQKIASRIAKARRPSTQIVYNAKWNVFSNWCKSRSCNPEQPSMNNLASFFLHLFEEKNLAVSTIKGYRSMISNTLKFKGGESIGCNPFLSELIRSFELERPVSRNLTPKWDLSCVLWSLTKLPYEPLSEASIKFLTMKTAFLLAFATARRRSELHALSVEEGCLRFNKTDGSVSLLCQPGFLAKNQLPHVLPEPINVPSLANSCGNDDTDRVLCPVRSLKYYLKRVKPLRGSRKRLFLPIKGNKDISAASVSRWISDVIKLAYQDLSDTDLSFLQIRPHELRALSSSWAFLNNAPLEDVLRAAFWRSPTTFSSFYLRSFSAQASNLHSLGPLVAS